MDSVADGRPDLMLPNPIGLSGELHSVPLLVTRPADTFGAGTHGARLQRACCGLGGTCLKGPLP